MKASNTLLPRVIDEGRRRNSVCVLSGVGANSTTCSRFDPPTREQ